MNTHCANGHEMTPENTHLFPYRDTFRRHCRTCLTRPRGKQPKGKGGRTITTLQQKADAMDAELRRISMLPLQERLALSGKHKGVIDRIIPADIRSLGAFNRS